MGSSCSTVQKPKRPSMTSSIKEKPLINGDSSVKVVDSSFSLKSSEFGIKDETFFDTRAWLDSDCDDDFFSVNGDLTPSRGNTPNNQISIPSRDKSDKTNAFDKFPDSKSEPSPSPTGRKRLSDLFQEAREESAYEEEQETNGEHDLPLQTKSEEPPERANSAGTSGDLAPSRELKSKRKAGGKAARCCLPSLSQSFSERRQKTSPIHLSA